MELEGRDPEPQFARPCFELTYTKLPHIQAEGEVTSIHDDCVIQP